MIYILIFLVSLVLTIVSLPYVINLLTKLDIVDMPDQRKLHPRPVPRMGGIVIFAVTFITLFSFVPNLYMLRLILVSSTMLLICGMIDDRKGVNWRKKFLVQFIAAGSLVIFLAPMFDTIRFFTLEIPDPWSYLLLTVFIVGAINSINLLDGMDGLVTGFSLLIFFFIFWLAYLSHNYFLLFMSAALLGTTLGFLKYNAYPAKVFLGDAGSLVLGMFIVVAALLITPGFNNGNTLSITFPVILLGLPIIDTLKVMAIRIWNRKNPFLPDRNHFHHVLISSNIRQKNIVFILRLISVAYIMIAYYYMIGSKGIALFMYVLLAFPIVLMKPILTRILSSRKIKTDIVTLIDKVPGG